MTIKKIPDDGNAPTFPTLSRWLLKTESTEVRKNLIKALAAFCTLLLIANFAIHIHGYAAVEEVPGFYALAGFVAFAFIIYATKLLKKLLSRPENYYGNGESVDSEDYPSHKLGLKEYGDD